MISYELAQELKDAGYPQDYDGGVLGRFAFKDDDIDEEMAYSPSFEELIESVKTHPMNRKDVGLYAQRGKYIAWARKTRLDEGGDGERDLEGDTPTEAMARLWLALNNGKKGT